MPEVVKNPKHILGQFQNCEVCSSTVGYAEFISQTTGNFWKYKKVLVHVVTADALVLKHQVTNICDIVFIQIVL